jgi:hypothetical protein
MHTSLDQALGRNPRLNRVGQSLLNIASGASAAYSLRSLTGGDPNVVRVRRDSDNAERDFTASEVSSGELTTWVNSQTTLPLDLRTLQSDGRTGAIIDAKAAYSLRNLSSSYTGNVVEVRRSSDNDTRSFTASEVSDGTLTDFVGSGNDGFVKTWYDQSSTTGTANNNHATQSDPSKQPKIVNAGTYLSEIDFDGSNHYFDLTSAIGATTESAVFTVAESGGGTDNFIIDNRDAGGDGFRLFRGGSQLKFNWQAVTIANGTLSTDTKFIGFGNHSSSVLSVGVNGASTTSSDSNSVSVTATPRIGARSFTSPSGYWDGTMNELIIYDTDQTDNRTALEANIGEHYSISGIPAYDNTVNGFVETWYDQSGSGNNATQTSADLQPKIVSSGSLQQDADGNTAVKFDGTDDYLAKSDASPELFGPYTFFTHTDRDGDNGNPFSITGDADLSARYFAIYQNADTSQFNPRSNTSQTVSQTGLTGTDVRLTTVNTTSDTSYSVGTNGAAFTTGTTSYGTMPADPDGCPRIIIGKLREGATSAVQIFGGFITEIIAYAGTTNGDQSGNRTAVETNMANYYGITLS